MTADTLEKTYDPQAIEHKWYESWEASGQFSPSGKGKPFCLMIPPPNVTGSLHMGHAFEATIMDALVRYHRMKGHNTLWQGGTDHAGIATQMVVERQLKAKNTSRLELGREAFIEKIWEWKHSSGGTISQQQRRMGSSIDWNRERFTMDEGLSGAVQEVFVRLYDEGIIYRGKRLVNWDPVLHTAISDLEVVSEQEKGSLWHIDYPLSDDSGKLTIATTRPETLFGDAAIAVHPEDERYQSLLGKTVKLPLTDREIPIIADEYVEREFGTGCVKITPAHDFNDYEVGLRHDLPKINILTQDAALNDNVPPCYQGLDRFAARKKVIEDLTNQDLLAKTDDHTLMVPRGDRSGSVIEPYLTDQWYVKVASMAEPAIKAVQNGDIEFVPKQWENTYYAWMNDIQDWCISRQLWWGHRIPAWYDDNGRVYVGQTEEAVREKYKLADTLTIRQDEDVLDTWFSSALWPFSTLGWPENSSELETFYPTNVLVTGFDIIFFWVARMIMFGLKFTGKVPFSKVYIHGLIRDSDGLKMSKSKGNVLDPLDIIDGISAEELINKRTTGLMQPQMAEKIARKTRKEFPEGINAHGTDALRFTFASLASTGRNIQFDFKRLEGYRNFCNKLWNAARYVLMHTNGNDSDLGDGAVQYTLADRWIRSRLQKTIADVRKNMDEYRFDLAANALYEFAWHEFCDWYLELSKPVLTKAQSAATKRGTLQTLVDVFEHVLRLLHPLIPFVTEEIWQQIAPLSSNAGGQLLMSAEYPNADAEQIDPQAESDVTWLKDIIVTIRNIRGELNLSPSLQIPVLLHNGTAKDLTRFEQNQGFLQTLAKLDSVEYLSDASELPASASALVGKLEVKVPLAGLIDPQAESARLSKELKKHQKELSVSENKLSNPNYVERAPKEVVETERARVEQSKRAIEKIEQQIMQLQAL